MAHINRYIRIVYMKFTKFIKDYHVEIGFVLLVAVFFYMYFVVYMTPSKVAWYNEMNRQIDRYIYEIRTLGH